MAGRPRPIGDAFSAFSGNYSGAQNGDAFTASFASGGAVDSAVIGSYDITVATVTALAPASLSNYTLDLRTAANGLIIGPAALSVTANAATKIYGQANPTFSVSYSGFVLGQDASVLGGSLNFNTTATAESAVGGYDVTPGGLTSDNYAITFHSGTLTVTPAGLVVTPANQSKTYGDGFTAFSGNVGGIQNADAITASYGSDGAVSTAAVGSYDITATLNDPDGKLGNYTVTLNTGHLVVGTRTLIVTPDGGKAKTYGDDFSAFSGSYSGAQNGDAFTATFASSGAAGAAATGSYDITVVSVDAVAPASLTNYTLDLQTAVSGLTVGQRTLIVTPDGGKIKTFGDTFTAFSGNYSGAQNGDVFTATFASAGAADSAAAGGYDITVATVEAIAPASLANYTLDLRTATNGLNIGPTTLNVTVNPATKVYGQPNPAFSVSYGGFVLGQDASVLGGSLSFNTVATAESAVGGYQVTPSGLTATNYALAFNAGTLTVTPAGLVVTPADKTKIFGETFTAFSGNVIGVQNSDAITASYGSTGATSTAAVGSYDITATIGDSDGKLGNYTVTLNIGHLVVGPRTLVVTPDGGKTKTYGDAFSGFTGEYSGAQNGDAFTATLASSGAAAAAAAGSYDITVATVNAVAPASLSNYALDLQTAVSGLTVGPRTLIVTPDGGKTKTYGDAFSSFTGNYSGAQNGDAFTASFASVGAADSAAPGNYDITVATVNPIASASLSNYTLDLRTATNGLTIGPAALTVTANAAAKTYGQANPSFGVSYSGFVLGQDAGVLGGSLAFNTTATTGSPVGSYDVTPSGLNSSNYAIAFHSAALTVSQASPAIGWTAPAAITYGTALDGTQLNASAAFQGAPLSGSFVYTPAAGTVLDAGSGQALGAVFTPTDTTNFSGGTASVTIDVAQAPATLALTGSSLSQVYDGSPEVVIVTTIPPGLSGVSVTYNGSVTPPTAVGTYAVVASLVSVDYSAADAIGSLTITPALEATPAVTATPAPGATATTTPSGGGGTTPSTSTAPNAPTTNNLVGGNGTASFTLSGGQTVTVVVNAATLHALQGALPGTAHLAVTMDLVPPITNQAMTNIGGGGVASVSSPIDIQVRMDDQNNQPMSPSALQGTVIDLTLPVLPSGSQPGVFTWLEAAYDGTGFVGYVRPAASFDPTTGLITLHVPASSLQGTLFLPAMVTPAWVQNFNGNVHIYSSWGKEAVDFGVAGPQFTTFLVVGPQVGKRIYVYNSASNNYGWIDASGVGPVGPAR